MKKPLNPKRSVPTLGIVHLGPGNFFRAFVADFTQDAILARADTRWGMESIAMRSATARDALAPRGNVYTCVSLDANQREAKEIDILRHVWLASTQPKECMRALTAPEVKVVTLTITEKGYCRGADGRLDLSHPDIAHDLSKQEPAKSAIGLLVGALGIRKQAGVRPFTLLSCDNLPANGAVLKTMILDFAARVDPALAAWIETDARFPCSMVDRITPATTAEDIAKLEEQSGIHDRAMVVHEPFRQWVIEDDFVDGVRPPWDLAGAQFVDDVAAFEHMKLRCLNGTHSALAYLGYLAGFETIAQTVGQADFAAYCQKLWREEIIPSLQPPQGADLQAYCQTLLARYQNPAIAHRTWQIAMDGSQKLPQRLLGTITDNLAAGRPIKGLSLAVAAWMIYVGGRDEQGKTIDVQDPHAADLKDLSESADTPNQQVKALLSFEAVFPPELAANSVFRGEVTSFYRALIKQGAKETIRALVGEMA